jgi:RNA polymerase-binding transcription factor DksA
MPSRNVRAPWKSSAADPAAARAAGVPERLLRILEALSRMRTGKYGVCHACRNPIPYARLLAIPETLACVNCS